VNHPYVMICICTLARGEGGGSKRGLGRTLVACSGSSRGDEGVCGEAPAVLYAGAVDGDGRECDPWCVPGGSGDSGGSKRGLGRTLDVCSVQGLSGGSKGGLGGRLRLWLWLLRRSSWGSDKTRGVPDAYIY